MQEDQRRQELRAEAAEDRGDVTEDDEEIVNQLGLQRWGETPGGEETDDAAAGVWVENVIEGEPLSKEEAEREGAVKVVAVVVGSA